MKAEFSPWLASQAAALKELIAQLSSHYDHVSILATDSRGFLVLASQHNRMIDRRTLTTERGVVVRVHRDGLYSEYAFNAEDLADPGAVAARLRTTLDAQLSVLSRVGTGVYDTPAVQDPPLTIFAEMETDGLPEETDPAAVMELLGSYSDRAVSMDERIVECQARVSSTHVNKMFLTAHRDERQSYVFTEASLFVIGSQDGRTEMAYADASDRNGPGIISRLEDQIGDTVKNVLEMLTADRVEPGEYEIITSPEVTGLIAHEAFGHGVEMDMFVKKRALGAEYIGKRVGSDLVTMHEGAACAVDVTSYAFDDEGVPAGDVTEIDRGILKTGICDTLSALRLGCEPTGNGKRQNFEHKVYTRMTNTMFDSGSDTLEEMIASVKKGYLLEGMHSGMEDPKHWGIQCIIARGREIVDGRLTGRVVAPVVMTGYVPDLLGSVSMVSGDRASFGNGACGKGHKEWVKVADGGPYLKARARLG
ncbi:MAG: TldD/PmbA family protein [Lachnospiraceae bacterium]|nr:TldD/PmbA family protein [Lachnospiraceae bacterium]